MKHICQKPFCNSKHCMGGLHTTLQIDKKGNLGLPKANFCNCTFQPILEFAYIFSFARSSSIYSGPL